MSNEAKKALPPMEQLIGFVDWERKHNPGHKHVAEWALEELERLHAELATRTLWVAGKHRGALADGTPAWDLQGIFASEAAAIAACAEACDFVGPVPVNQPLPQEATAWPGCRYPLAVE